MEAWENAIEFACASFAWGSLPSLISLGPRLQVTPTLSGQYSLPNNCALENITPRITRTAFQTCRNTRTTFQASTEPQKNNRRITDVFLPELGWPVKRSTLGLPLAQVQAEKPIEVEICRSPCTLADPCSPYNLGGREKGDFPSGTAWGIAAAQSKKAFIGQPRNMGVRA